MGRSQVVLNEPLPEAADFLSVSGWRWKQRPCDERHQLALTQQQGIPYLIARVLAQRGVALDEVDKFLKPTLRDFLPDPFHLIDMDKAASRVAAAIMRRETIAIFGDYDVDGATSSALLIRYFRALGIHVLLHIPDRLTEGYGPNTPALLSLKERGASLVITVDCGTSAHAPLLAAQEAGLDVLVIDHHKGSDTLPKAYALVNPNRLDETSEHTQLAAVGVAFLLLVAVNKCLREQGVQPPDLMQWLDLVALGSICDVVPLTGVNRALVTQGLKMLRQRRNPGIAAIMDVAQLSEPPETYHAGFIIGPRINAGGRVGKSDLGARLLSTDDPTEARAIAQELNQFNAERKAIESNVQEEALQDASALPASDAVLVVARQGWHPGVIGIVAGRLKDHFHKPVAVIALDNAVGKASARSIAGVDLGAAVIAAVQNNIVLGGGGHTMAAGFTIAHDRIPHLRSLFNHILGARVAALSYGRVRFFDSYVSLSGITVELVRLLAQAGPFGAGNPSVKIMLTNVRIVYADKVGADHVRAVIADSDVGGTSKSIKAIAFRAADTPIGNILLQGKGRTFDLIGQLKINAWQGRESVDIFIDDLIVK